MISSTKRLNPAATPFLPLGLDSGTSIIRCKNRRKKPTNIQLKIKKRMCILKEAEEEEGKRDDSPGVTKTRCPSKSNNTSFYAFCPDIANCDIPETKSVSLLLQGLPADCTSHKLLDAIRGYGRIWSVTIHPPSPWNLLGPDSYDKKPTATATATLSFFEVAAARRFLEDAEWPSFFVVGGRRVRVGYHARRMASKEQQLPTQSRCVLVEGHPDLVNETALLALLRSRLVFFLGRRGSGSDPPPEVRHRLITARRNCVELRFDGFYGKAALAVDVLLLENDPRIASVRYADDPCA